jgi:hypothetical protein
MNANPEEGIMPLMPKHRPVPAETNDPSPSAPRAVNDRSRSKSFVRAQIAHASKSRCISHTDCARGLLALNAKEPGGSDKSNRRKTVPLEIIARIGN